MCIDSKVYSYRYTLMTKKNGWKEGKPQTYVGELDENTLIWENRHHFFTTCIWDALNVSANRTKVSLMCTEKCSDHESLLERLKNYLVVRNRMRTRSLGLLTSKVIRSNARNDTATWRMKRFSNCFRSLHHVLMTNSRRKNSKRWEICQTFCSQIVLKCVYLARIGRPDILWSVNKLARSVRKWTRACDKRLARSISCIHDTSDYRQYCHVGNTSQQCRLGLFQD